MSHQHRSHRSKYQTRLNREELEAHLAAATAPAERRRVQVLLYLAAGMPLTDIGGWEYLRRLRTSTGREGDQRTVEL